MVETEDTYEELCSELLHALEGSPNWYVAQWGGLIGRVRGKLWTGAVDRFREQVVGKDADNAVS